MEHLHAVIGPLATNVYILADPRTREAIAIDTATPSLAWIADELVERSWTLKLIVSPRVRCLVVPATASERKPSLALDQLHPRPLVADRGGRPMAGQHPEAFLEPAQAGDRFRHRLR